jgi:hypothetical protein
MPLPPELGNIHLGAGQKREDDARERADEVQPGGDAEREDVADEHAGEELDERDREAGLDGDRRREEDRRPENCCYGDVAHALPPVQANLWG